MKIQTTRNFSFGLAFLIVAFFALPLFGDQSRILFETKMNWPTNPRPFDIGIRVFTDGEVFAYKGADVRKFSQLSPELTRSLVAGVDSSIKSGATLQKIRANENPCPPKFLTEFFAIRNSGERVRFAYVEGCVDYGIFGNVYTFNLVTALKGLASLPQFLP